MNAAEILDALRALTARERVDFRPLAPDTQPLSLYPPVAGRSYEMFLASNRKDEGIYYTPAGITGPMADSLVNALTGPIVDALCAAVGSQTCDFAAADKLMAQLADIRVADTACGSGGFLIKVLRAFWRQYQRIEAASAWVGKILKPDNGEMFLAELPPNVERALSFRRRHGFENRRELAIKIAETHQRCPNLGTIGRNVTTLGLCRAIIELSGGELHFSKLTGTTKAFPDFRKIFGFEPDSAKNSIRATCRKKLRHDWIRENCKA
jgi:hypothetical protein